MDSVLGIDMFQVFSDFSSRFLDAVTAVLE